MKSRSLDDLSVPFQHWLCHENSWRQSCFISLSFSCEPIPDPSTTAGTRWKRNKEANQSIYERRMLLHIIIYMNQNNLSTGRAKCTTFHYFPLCCEGFSPGNFLSNFPPLAVAVAAMPATLPSSSLATFWVLPEFLL